MHYQKESPTEARKNEEDLKRIFPPFKKWKHLYGFIIVELLVLIVLLYFFNIIFS